MCKRSNYTQNAPQNEGDCISASFLTGTVILSQIFIQKDCVSSIGNWMVLFLSIMSRPVMTKLSYPIHRVCVTYEILI